MFGRDSAELSQAFIIFYGTCVSGFDHVSCVPPSKVRGSGWLESFFTLRLESCHTFFIRKCLPNYRYLDIDNCNQVIISILGFLLCNNLHHIATRVVGLVYSGRNVNMVKLILEYFVDMKSYFERQIYYLFSHGRKPLLTACCKLLCCT